MSDQQLRGTAPTRREAIEGALLGTALGDAVGLPLENLSPRRAARLFPGPPRPRLLLGRGWCSDDTEHACLTAQALLRADGEPDAFARALGWRLRGWVLGAPAGIGFATLRACLKLLVGFPPRLSGVRSAGNGPAMRAALLGVCAPDEERLGAWVRVATRITHTDPQAEDGARLVALAARAGAARGPWSIGESAAESAALLAQVRAQAGTITPETARALDLVERHLADEGPALAEALGCARGVTAYMLHTLPIALHTWLRRPGDPRAAIADVLALGGDTDTVGAITGALVGATAGSAALPADWLAGLAEWPRSVVWMRRLAERLARRFPAAGPGETLPPEPLLWPALLPRNALFAAVVLLHGLRRLLPPY